jgi:hypothetical protein
MNRLNILQILSFFIYLLVQIVILRNAVLFHMAFCFLYIAYLLLMPVDSTSLVLLGVGFLFGFIIDLFYDSLGLHAFACVFIMYVRNFWLNLITPQGGYDSNTTPSLAANGAQWFLVYSVPLIFMHHALLFYIEAGGFGMFWFTLWKVIFSTMFTTLVVVITQYLFPDGRRI